MKKISQKELTEMVRYMLGFIGEDPDRAGLKETPDRFIAAMCQMTSGYDEKPDQLLKTFKDGFRKTDEMILVRHIEFSSLCEHHLLPFTGVAHVAYIPSTAIVGLSKIPRVVDAYARRLQVQERLTQQVTDCLQRVLKPKGVATVTVAKHSCMSCRGVRKSGADMVCSALTGAFKKSAETRAEFLNLIGGL